MKTKKHPETAKNHQTRNEDFHESTYGVVGVCGVVGNLIARVLMDHGFNVTCTDIKHKDECRFMYTLEPYIKKYNTPIYFSDHPESFLTESNYIIPPPSLPKTSKLFKKIKENGTNILEVEDILRWIKPDKPVICITGTNGKTTTTTLLKHICRSKGLEPTEHGFRDLQGNIDYIPPLQARLSGNVAVLETGTFGVPEDLKRVIESSNPSCGIITNITPDHLDEDHDFLSYANIKGDFIECLKDRQLIVNSDDPTLWGLIKSKNCSNVVNFGVDSQYTVKSVKKCWCGREVSINETISGVGYYECECGLKRSEPDYLATDINKSGFTLKTPHGSMKLNPKIMGLHNIYNIIGAVAGAVEFFKIPLEDLKEAVESFEGVPGRLEYIFTFNEKDVIVDYGHNPAGVETVLRELKKVYNKLTAVVTISSESGASGDDEIFRKSLELADFVVPASSSSRTAAEKHLPNDKIVMTSRSLEKFKEGTLGATKDQVIEGLKMGLKCNSQAVVCLGEAAFKYKEPIMSLENL
jgi:UDP-N-acetylmuramate--alanine ligase